MKIIENAGYKLAKQGLAAELTLHGDIYESPPTDYYGEPIPEAHISLTQFLEDFGSLGDCTALTVKINSYGGDAGASLTIHNRLRELSAAGTHVTCVVEGFAMSGGSLILSAGDTVAASPSSLIMLHRCLGFYCGAYNAVQLRSLAKAQDAWDGAQMEVYRRKTGWLDSEILTLMEETTYWTGREAFEKGLVDVLLEEEEPLSVVASGRYLQLGERQTLMPPGVALPDGVKQVNPKAVPLDSTHLEANKGGETGLKTTEDLKASFPEVMAQLEAEIRAQAVADLETDCKAKGAQEERDRLQKIEVMAHLFPQNLVFEAKYGTTACTAESLAYRAAQEAQQHGTLFLNALDADAKASGVLGVRALAATDDGETAGEATPEQQHAQAKARVVALLQKEDQGGKNA